MVKKPKLRPRLPDTAHKVFPSLNTRLPQAAVDATALHELSLARVVLPDLPDNQVNMAMMEPPDNRVKLEFPLNPFPTPSALPVAYNAQRVLPVRLARPDLPVHPETLVTVE
jgi:hypothetical protein